jgi:predicted transcriptional regulator
MSAKEAVIDMVQRMPDDASVSDIVQKLYVRQMIDEGLKELDAGLGIDHEEIKRRHAEWLA